MHQSVKFLRLCLALALVAAWLRPVFAVVEPKTGEPALPAVFDKQLPENVSDLRDIEKHVQELVRKVSPAVVGVRIGQSQGSGVIVTKDGYVLTAGHVSGQPDRDAQIVLPDGRKLKAKTLGANRFIDSGMVKITDAGEFPHIDLGKSGELKKGNWCLAIGHPGGVKQGRAPVVRLGRVLESSKGMVRTDCALVGGDSGGPLFDMHGKVIGIHSRIGLALTFNIHVPVDTYTETWDRLAKGEAWGNPFGFGGGKPANVYLGILVEFADKTKITKVEPNSPAEKAGLQVNDIVTQIDGKKFASQLELNKILFNFKPNDEIAVEVQRGAQMLSLKLKLERRPAGG